MEKINIVEILKNSPKGTMLYSTVHGYVELIDFYRDTIRCKFKHLNTIISFYSDGKFMENTGECILFPSKENRDWSTFQRPFKDGDIIFEDRFHSICLFKKEGTIKGTVDYYCGISFGGFYVKDEKNIDEHFGDISDYRLATKEERQKLFDAIKTNGYKWDNKTMTLEKLIVPKFKVGDKIVKRNSVRFPGRNSWIVVSINSKFYEIKLSEGIGNIGVIPISEQDDWVLVSNKLDINTLKPFEEVLVRCGNLSEWSTGIFSHTVKSDNKLYFIVNTQHWEQCIPYKGNEHLRGKTDACSDYFKTWEE